MSDYRSEWDEWRRRHEMFKQGIGADPGPLPGYEDTADEYGCSPRFPSALSLPLGVIFCAVVLFIVWFAMRKLGVI